MTCLEAQSNIMRFIDGDLPDDKAADFVKHIRYCPNCYEELEISFTLIVGMKQLDNNEELYHDFSKAIDVELSKVESRIKKAKRFKISTFGVAFAVFIVFMLLFYQRCLNRVYYIEQIMKKYEQGNSYFYDYFCDDINMCKDDFIENWDSEEEEIIPTFYEKVRLYNFVNRVPVENNVDDELKDDLGE